MASNVLDNSQENNGGMNEQNGRDEVESKFECNICFEMAKDPVVSMCGHLFCWPCLHQWLDTRPNCPVCRSEINKDKVIPIYGRGGGDRDPRDKIPPRPQAQGQRTEETSRRPQAQRTEETSQRPRDPRLEETSQRPRDPRLEETSQRPRDPRLEETSQRPRDPRLEETSQRPRDPRLEETSQGSYGMSPSLFEHLRLIRANQIRLRSNSSSTMQQPQAQSSNSYSGLTTQQKLIYDYIRFDEFNIFGNGVHVERIRADLHSNNDFDDDLRFLLNAEKIRTTFDDNHYATVPE